MMSMQSLVKQLTERAKWNENKAFAILGARPGPGYDIIIRPVEPICGRWYADGRTKCGQAFIRKFWIEQPLTNQKVAELRKQANEWGLTHHTNYNVMRIE